MLVDDVLVVVEAAVVGAVVPSNPVLTSHHLNHMYYYEKCVAYDLHPNTVFILK